MNPTLVTASFVGYRVDARDIMILDVTLRYNLSREQMAQAFAQGHVKSAVQLLLTAEMSTSLLALPAPPLLQFLMNETDFYHGKALILYDDDSVSALRAWWLFQSYNFQNISIMNCRFSDYKEQNLPVEVGPARRMKRPRHARFFAAMKLPLLLSDQEQEWYYILAKQRHDIRLYDAEERKLYLGIQDTEGYLESDVFKIRQLMAQEKLDPTAHTIISCDALKNGILVVFALFMLTGEYPKASIHLKTGAVTQVTESMPKSAI